MEPFHRLSQHLATDPAATLFSPGLYLDSESSSPSSPTLEYYLLRHSSVSGTFRLSVSDCSFFFLFSFL